MRDLRLLGIKGLSGRMRVGKAKPLLPMCGGGEGGVSMIVQGEQVRITGQPDVDRVTIAIGEACEIRLPSDEAMQFACLLFSVASQVYAFNGASKRYAVCEAKSVVM